MRYAGSIRETDIDVCGIVSGQLRAGRVFRYGSYHAEEAVGAVTGEGVSKAVCVKIFFYAQVCALRMEINMSELELKSVSYQYKGNRRNVLEHVSCAFDKGEVTAVIGPSGSGKTTLLSLMAGLDEPTGGSLWVQGENMGQMDLDAYRRQKASVIFQAFQLFPRLTVLENVCYPMELNGINKKDAKMHAMKNLEAVGIGEEKYKRFPSRLSGGEQQRVAIARALSSGAGILLADEPTGNLDGENSRNIVSILMELAHKNDYCVIIVTHDMGIAEVADKVYRMEDGILTLQEKSAS